MSTANEYYKRYSIPFVGNAIGEPVEYRIELWQRRPSGEVVELDGAPSPFVLSVDNNEDLLTPIRTSTARISFVDDIDIEDISPADGFEWKVRLVNAATEAIVFTGFLSGEVFTQPYIEGPNIITINAVSPMVSALATNMDIAERSSLSIGETLALMVEMCEDVNEVYIPAIYTVNEYSSPSNYTEVLRLRYSAAMYRDYVDNPMLTGEKYECRTYGDAINDICALLGWTLTDVGDGKIYLVASGYNGNYIRLALGDLKNDSPFTPRYAAPAVSEFDAIEAVDTLDSTEVRQGYNSVMISTEGSSADAQLFNVEGQVKKWQFSTLSSTVNVFQAGGGGAISTNYARVGMKQATLTFGDVSLPQYEVTFTPREDGYGALAVDWNEREGAAPSFLNAVAGAFYIEHDSASLKQVEPAEGEAEKKEWSFTPMLRFKEQSSFVDPNGNTWVYTLYQYYPLLKVVAPFRLFPQGAIVIDFDMRATLTDGFWLAADERIGGGDIENVASGYDPTFVSKFWGEEKKVAAQLRVGNLYWSGSAWTSAVATFEIPVSVEEAEWHSVISNKTVDMPYSGSRGLYIPIAATIVGDLEFKMYPAFSLRPNYFDPNSALRTTGREPFVDIKGLAVRYTPIYDFVDIEDLSSKYYKAFEASFPNSKEVSLKLHSSTNRSVQLSLLFDEYNHALDTIWRGEVENKPEQFLLQDYERIYARMLRRWRRGLAIDALRPIDVWSRGADVVLVPTGASIDYAEGTGEIYLSEIKPLTI